MGSERLASAPRTAGVRSALSAGPPHLVHSPQIFLGSLFGGYVTMNKRGSLLDILLPLSRAFPLLEKTDRPGIDMARG